LLEGVIVSLEHFGVFNLCNALTLRLKNFYSEVKGGGGREPLFCADKAKFVCRDTIEHVFSVTIGSHQPLILFDWGAHFYFCVRALTKIFYEIPSHTVTNACQTKMTTEFDREDQISRPTLPRTTVRVVHRSSTSPQTDVFPSPRSGYLDYDGPASPAILTRNDRAYDQTHRWTVLAREAEADEVSILSVTSEEIGYYASILPDEPVPPPPTHEPSEKRNLTIATNETKKDSPTTNGPQTTYIHTTKEGNTYQLTEVDISDAIQFSPPLEPAPFLEAPEDEQPAYTLRYPSFFR
jgi:hypothetical protein